MSKEQGPSASRNSGLPPEIQRDREVERFAKAAKLPPYMWDTLGGLAALVRFMDAVRSERGLTFDDGITVSTTQPRLTVGTPEWREWLDVQVDANFIIGYTGTRDDLQAVAEKAQRIADIAAKHTTGKSTASATQERTDG